MTFKQLFIVSFSLFTSSLLFSQNEVCTGSSEDDLLMELNTIDKCLSQNEEVKEELPKVKTKRYLRTRRNNYYHTLRKNLKSVSSTKNIVVKKIKAKDVYLGEVTQEPTLVSLENQAKYKGRFKDVLEAYVSDNLIYPSVLEHNGVEGIVWTSFVIDVNGDVKNIVTLGPINGELFEVEAAKVIKNLPKFNPGKIDDELVNVKHLMAIKFEVNK
ncbi:energy transducer TonB [Tenacibaculum sp. MEBiC06402]|uniref:energy transducer TonB n=1 Tax=unclassified Tenacibaculum TaxID=2635139 RepID=UPI003B9A5F80